MTIFYITNMLHVHVHLFDLMWRKARPVKKLPNKPEIDRDRSYFVLILVGSGVIYMCRTKRIRSLIF